MATRQYIGARYVPKFDGIHDINKAYEPLTIVTDSNYSVSYTSKKYVPVGIALTNDEYWAVTGTVSGAILDLQNRMSIAETDIDTLNIDFKNLDTRVNALEHPADGYLLIGDSYLNGVATSNSQGWGSHFKTLRNIPDDKYFRYASNGAGLVATGSGGKTFEQILNDAISEMTPTQKKNIGSVIILGGYNDANYNSSYSDMMNAKISLLNKIHTNYPNAVVYIGVVGKDIEYAQNGADVRTRMRGRVIPAYSNSTDVETAQFTYLQNLNLVLDSSLMANVNHPSDNGNKQIAIALDSAMRGDYRQGINNSNVDITLPNGNEIGFVMYRSDRCTYIDAAGNQNIDLSGDIEINGNIPIGTFSGEIYPSTIMDINIPVQIMLQHSSGWKIFNGSIILKYDKTAVLSIRELDGNTWKTYKNPTFVVYSTNVVHSTDMIV